MTIIQVLKQMSVPRRNSYIKRVFEHRDAKLSARLNAFCQLLARGGK